MDDRFRLSDADRDRAAALLRDHFAAGRLTAEELDERLTVTLRATTFGDLRRVLAGLPGPAPVPQQPSGLPSRAALERCYRRLLVFYPAQYRRVHEEEMLAVLMTAAPSGKRRPGPAEAADLIWGALRVRLQPSRADPAEPAWRDALAVLSVILPVIILLISIVQETQMWLFTRGALDYGFPLSALQQPALAAIVMAVILLRLRRVAILAAAVLFLWAAFLSGGGTLVYATVEAYLFVPLGLEIVALAASPGPRRGLQILTWKHGALAVIVTLVVSATSYPAAVIVIAVICAAMALASSLGRWLVVLLAVAAWPFFFGGPLAYLGPFSGPGFRIALAYLPPGLALIAWTYLPPLVLLVLAVIAARRESLRPASFPPASG